jgi:putative hemolysin
MSVTTEILIIFVMVLINGLLSMAEMAMVSARKTRLQELARNGDLDALEALEVSKEPNKFLSAIQIGITLVGIFAGVFGGATLAKSLTAWLTSIGLPVSYSSGLGIGVVVVSITYLSLVIGELVPKRLALSHAEKIAGLVAAPMRIMSRVASPLIAILSVSTDAVLLVLRVRKKPDEYVTEEEIKIMMEQGTQAGVFEECEQDMVKRVLSLGDRDVNDLMTHRPDVVALDIEDTTEENWKKIQESGHSVFPVYEHEVDNIQGIVSVKDLWAQSSASDRPDIKSLLTPALFVPEGLTVYKVLELFKQAMTHAALVIDEYGNLQGIITLHDILEAIVGDLPSLHMNGEAEAIQREDGSWLLDALLPVDKFKEIFEIEEMPGEDKGYYDTLGGFMLVQFGQIPSSGAYFIWNGLKFEVMDMDGQRIDKVLVLPAS